MNNFEFCYRVRQRDDDTWIVHVMFPPPNIGTTGWAKEYQTYDDLPELLKEKIAALDLVRSSEDVKGVGRKHPSIPPTYWCYHTEDIFAGEHR